MNPLQGKSITGSAAESGCNWDRDGFKQWEGWTTEDFIYHEATGLQALCEHSVLEMLWQVETNHDTIKNSPLMRKIVPLS